MEPTPQKDITKEAQVRDAKTAIAKENQIAALPIHKEEIMEPTLGEDVLDIIEKSSCKDLKYFLRNK
jgi:hypothetical protein